jgi:hypothetical protein
MTIEIHMSKEEREYYRDKFKIKKRKAKAVGLGLLK